jgi:hypothetical protein
MSLAEVLDQPTVERPTNKPTTNAYRPYDWARANQSDTELTAEFFDLMFAYGLGGVVGAVAFSDPALFQQATDHRYHQMAVAKDLQYER